MWSAIRPIDLAYAHFLERRRLRVTKVFLICRSFPAYNRHHVETSRSFSIAGCEVAMVRAVGLVILLHRGINCVAPVAFAQNSTTASVPPNTVEAASSSMTSPCDPSKRNTPTLRWPTRAEAWADFIDELGGLDKTAQSVHDSRAISSNDFDHVVLNREQIGLSPDAWHTAYAAMLLTYYQVRKQDQRYQDAVRHFYDQPPATTQQELDALLRQRPSIYESGVDQLRATIGSSEFSKLDSFVCRRPNSRTPIHLAPANAQ